jgi:ribosome modulation factor
MKRLIKKIALENDVPQNGARAFAEGWDVTACPFNHDPLRQRWIDEWNAAAIALWRETQR